MTSAESSQRLDIAPTVAPIVAPDTALDIAMGFDAGYAPHAAGVIASVVRHAPGARFRFLVLHADIDRALQIRIEAAAPGHRFDWIEVRDDDMPAFSAGEHAHLNRSTLFRLGLEKLAPADCKRVLYLDADIAVLADVRRIAGADLGGHPVGAVIDAWIDEAEFAARWKLDPGGSYFNAGVMLIDLDAVRAEGLFTQTIDLLARQGGDHPYHDQDALNRVFWMRWKAFETRWNVQRPMVLEPERIAPHKRLGDQAPAIVHFTTGHKPWLAGVWHPWTWLYWEALGRTSFLHEVARKNGVSFLKRQRLRLGWLRRRRRDRASGA